MKGTTLGRARIAAIAGLAALTLGVGLGGSGRLTYHEAFVAQAAREMVRGGGLGLVPTIDGRPWLEKPPLSTWMAAGIGWAVGDVTEAAARLPSALAAALMAVGIAVFAARRFGADAGLLAGAVQATTGWTVLRGRLAEADIVLACLIVWVMVAFDRVREPGSGRRWLWAFFALLGMTSLAKGLGFGAVLAGSAAVAVLLWDRDRATARRLVDPLGWLLAAVLALAWPVAVVVRHPEAWSLWTLHVSDRMAARPEHFIGGPWWMYGPSVLGQVLPWTPLGLWGAWASFRRARVTPGGGDRLLWAWALVPVLVLSAATVKNGHYAIYALPPWSVWTALALVRVGERLGRRGWSGDRVRRAAVAGFALLGLGCGVGHLALGPKYDRRGVEWGFYATLGGAVDGPGPVAFLYEDWDRKPYPTPFGPVPHDWAVRLYYLDRPATWRQGADDLAARPPTPGRFDVVARDRDRPALLRLGSVEALARGPRTRFDREFVLFRVTPRGADGARSASNRRAAPIDGGERSL
ncbi:ArnT family glycosyltransferase [Tundrisphaera sp. TA3]|uniref:ArnT family glycosyltransferase n=1 Tax=Tundrisphaera sp. TA3 TaxID=3435775 RepID=UPI003EB76DB3